MRYVMAIGLIIVSVALLTAGDDDAIKKATKEAEGRWTAVSMEVDGKKVPDAELKDLRVVIKDGKWKIIKGKEVTAEGTYKIVTLDKEVRHADRTVVKGDDAGKTIKQISKVNGDILTVCAAPAEKERPTTFESKSGTGHILGVWRREKK